MQELQTINPNESCMGVSYHIISYFELPKSRANKLNNGLFIFLGVIFIFPIFGNK